MVIKVLNLYAGIGGNRKLWDNVQVTAIENNEQVAEIYKKLNRTNTFKHKYPDMKLYQEIIFLQNFFKGNWVVENVQPYYEPLIKPYCAGRHCFWSNKYISNLDLRTPKSLTNMNKNELMQWLDIHIDKNYYINGNHCERQILRNCVHPKLGKHVFDCIYKNKQVLLNGIL
jgi:DNA (cytosine-5)-methyltransferase 1